MIALLLLLSMGPTTAQVASQLELGHGDRVCLVGNALAERMQHAGHLEARLQSRFPELGLSFRNLGFSGDEVDERRRTAGFGSPDEWLDRCDANVVLAFFGFCESFDGQAGVADYEAALERWVSAVLATDYSGAGPPRVVLCSSIPFEGGPSALPDGVEHNVRIALYNAATQRVAIRAGVPFVDLFAPLKVVYEESEARLTIDGIHLNELGQRALARVIEESLYGPLDEAGDVDEALLEEVLAKNHLWFNRYRVTDGYNVYGGRSALRYTESITSGGQDYSKGLSNLEVLQRELDVLDAMCAAGDLRIHAAARGEDPDSAPGVELPQQIPVPTNRPGPHEFLTGEEALARMTPAKGMQIRLFAGEGRFPELVNPVQMSFDARGRLWVAAWPTYPHWQPGRPMNDKLVVLEDVDGDGRADRSSVFAHDLHNPTGFEFWNGGVLVANCPDLLFLEDTDGDGLADRRERVLHGLSSADTHHAANSFVFGPDGALYFQEGTFHQSQVESIHGVLRNSGGCVWRFEPRTRRVERYVPYGFANPHGHVFDGWGQDFVTDGTGNVNYYALPFTGQLDFPASHSSYFPFFEQRSRPAGGTEILSSSHFPDELQGNYLVANVIGFQGIFQYRVLDDGSGFGAEEVEPLVFSSDPNFRPVDIEVGPDGAVYFLDWHNPLIGHMQHHLRDPSRDREHGRVYRVSWEGGPKLEPVPITGRPVDELVTRLAERDARVRYRARGELWSRDSKAVIEAARAWGAGRPEGAEGEHDRLEALWLQAAHGAIDRPLLERLLASEDFRARAAATRVVRHGRHGIADALELLGARIDDEHPRVRLEALVALSHFGGGEIGARAAELALRTLEHESDRFIDYALEETLRALEPDWRAALVADPGFSTEAGVRHLLPRLSLDELKRVDRGAVVQRELLARHGLEAEDYAGAVLALAEESGEDPLDVWTRAVQAADESRDPHADHLIGSLFTAFEALAVPAQGDQLEERIRSLVHNGERASTRTRATAAWVDHTGRVDTGPALDPGDDTPFGVAGRHPLPDPRAVLAAASYVRNMELREQLFERALAALQRPDVAPALPMSARFVRLELPGEQRTLTLAEVEVLSGGVNVAPQGTASQSTTNWNGTADRAIDGNKSGTFGDGGQTHTVEDRPDPWWELDLGRELPIDEIVVWNRTEGELGRRLDGLVVRLLDADRRYVAEVGPPDEIGGSHTFALWSDPESVLRRAAIDALVGLELHPEQAAAAIAGAARDPSTRATAVAALRAMTPAAWGADVRSEVADWLLERFTQDPEADFVLPGGRELLVLAEELAPALEPELASTLLAERRKLGPQVFVVRPIRDAMVYDTTAITVVAEKPVELVFDNVDIMPHNLLVTAPGALARVGLAAEAMAREPDAFDRGFVPETDEVLFGTKLLQPGQSQTLRFEAPSEPGAYPYVCTFPGHWVRMNGVMTVVAGWDELGAPAFVGASEDAAAPARPFVRNWTADEFAGALESLDALDVARGRQLAEEASCLRCHAVDGEGGITGPDLREAVARLETAEALLAHVLDPSLEIREGFESELFFTSDGGVVAGRVMGEEPGLLLVQDDPYRDDVLELPADEVEERRVSTLSLMPVGLLSTLQREEVLALLAWLVSLR